jgi:transposase InsO family protein
MNHKSEANMLHAYRNAGVLTDKVHQSIDNVVNRCKICQKFHKSKGKPKVSLPKVMDFNQVVAINLKQFDKEFVLWMVDTFTHFIQGVVLKNKEAPTIVEALNSTWCWRFGFPSNGYWADNGPEFMNKEVEEYCTKFGINIKFSPNYSPWSNGLNEQNHYSADLTVRKMMDIDKKLSLQKAVEMASWTHNTNTNILGYCPMTLVTGKVIVFPGISTAMVATESMFDSESLRIHMDRHQEVMKKFRESEFSDKLRRASRL